MIGVAQSAGNAAGAQYSNGTTFLYVGYNGFILCSLFGSVQI